MLFKALFSLLISVCSFYSSLAHAKNWVSNADSVFHETPVFHIQTDKSLIDKVHWQISDTQEFDWISPDFKQISYSSQAIVLDEESKKLLIHGETYYFRFRTEAYQKQTSWSEPFSFSLGYPSSHSKEYHWTKNALIDENTWQLLNPYLIPSNHPVKLKLDAILHQGRPTTNAISMKMAGFESIGTIAWDKAFVAKHPQLKGFIIKAYLDDQVWMDDKMLLLRIQGAEQIRSAIKAYGFETYLKVPHKWLYQLPAHTQTHPGQKNFILIVEDMTIVDKEKNEKLYRKSISEIQLKALHFIINALGLADSVYIKNIPFSEDGKIAFVDTERFNLWPVPFQKLAKSLNEKRKKILQ